MSSSSLRVIADLVIADMATDLGYEGRANLLIDDASVIENATIFRRSL
jgi:hypothetical protein